MSKQILPPLKQIKTSSAALAGELSLSLSAWSSSLSKFKPISRHKGWDLNPNFPLSQILVQVRFQLCILVPSKPQQNHRGGCHTKSQVIQTHTNMNLKGLCKFWQRFCYLSAAKTKSTVIKNCDSHFQTTWSTFKLLKEKKKKKGK